MVELPVMDNYLDIFLWLYKSSCYQIFFVSTGKTANESYED